MDIENVIYTFQSDENNNVMVTIEWPPDMDIEQIIMRIVNTIEINVRSEQHLELMKKAIAYYAVSINQYDVYKLAMDVLNKRMNRSFEQNSRPCIPPLAVFSSRREAEQHE